MKILELKDDKVVISSEALGLAFLNTLWSRDKSKTKDKAFKDISFVFYYSDFSSPFFKYPPDQRENEIKKYALADEAYSKDKLVDEAIKSYTDLNMTPSMRMLESVNIAISKMDNYFRTVNFEEGGIDEIDKAGKFIERLPKLQDSVNQAMEICKKETVGNTRVRGGATVGLFEDK